jgi:ATPase subunit of ABC transporter with duplicated ATPase domains
VDSWFGAASCCWGCGPVRADAAHFVKQWGETQEEIEKEIKRRETACEPRPANPAGSSEYALELRDVRKSFGKTEIIRGTSLAVRPGERVAVIGPNGAGKSTLFNLISGRFGSSQRRHPAAWQEHQRPEAL